MKDGWLRVNPNRHPTSGGRKKVPVTFFPALFFRPCELPGNDLDPTGDGGETTGPMPILTRYVLAELAKVFLVWLTGLTLLMIIVGVVREAVMQNVPLGEVARLIPYILPDALRIATPATLLLATTSVYGRMSGSNEVLAAKALGIHPWSLLWPTFIAAFLVSLTTVWLNDLAVSWGRRGARRVVVEAVEEIVYSMLKVQRGYSSPNFSINVKGVEGRKLIRPTLTLPARDGTPAVTVTAEEAELQSDHAAGVLKIILRNGTVDVDGRLKARFRDVHEQEVQLRDATEAQHLSAHPSNLALRVIPQQLAEQKELIEQYERELAVRAAYQMLCGDFDELAGGQWEAKARTLEFAWGRLYRLMTEPHRRWSAGFSCLCFAWVGVPMAIRLRNRDFLTSFFLCFLPILIVYYPLLASAVDGAKSGTVPPYCVWTGNILLLCWGAWLMRRVIRY
jgi:lipopolysaccharide export system permease protein